MTKEHQFLNEVNRCAKELSQIPTRLQHKLFHLHTSGLRGVTIHKATLASLDKAADALYARCCAVWLTIKSAEHKTDLVAESRRCLELVDAFDLEIEDAVKPNTQHAPTINPNSLFGKTVDELRKALTRQHNVSLELNQRFPTIG
jgi:hypothetical protein